jgi:hypothetical protein
MDGSVNIHFSYWCRTVFSVEKTAKSMSVHSLTGELKGTSKMTEVAHSSIVK